MGRKKTFVGTQVSRVIEDDKLPNSVKKGMLNALLTRGELIDHVLEEMLAGIGTRAERLYDFAKNGHYVHGLPTGEFKVPGDSVLTAVKAVLDGIHGSPATMSYAHYGPPNTLHIGWMALIASHGYDAATNKLGVLSATKETDVWLHDMVIVIPTHLMGEVEQRSLQQWGVAARAGYTPERKIGSPETRALVKPSQIEIASNSIPEEHLRVEYVWIDAAKVLQKDSFTIPLTGYDDNAEYFHARYTVNGVVQYWMYKDGTGTHESLDQLFDSPAVTTNGQFFPFIYFRYGKVNELDDKTTESYKDGKKLVKYLGMDFDQVAEGVHQNPDIDDVEQAMMMFALPANTEDEQERAYLFTFFNNMDLAQGTDLQFQTEAQADIASTQLFGADIHFPGIVIQDKRFKMSLTNSGIYKIRKSGTVAPVGGHDSGLATFNVITDVVEKNADTGVETPYQISTPVTYHYYRRQVTESLYEEIQVVELQTRFHINGEFGVTGDEDDKILLIPLDHSITDSFSVPDRERLYARSLHYVFNSYVVIKLKWYQTEIFRAIIVIIAIIITIWSGGADGGSSIAAALSIGAYALAAQLIIAMVLEFIIIRAIFKLFVKAVGAEAAFVIAIIAAAFGVMTGFEGGALAGAPWADQLLSLASGLAQAASAQIQADMANLVGEISEFQKWTEEQLKLIDSAQDLLEQDHLLSPFVIFGEKPDDFYNRTVHSGNIGVVGIDAVSTFVDSKLTLPTLDETLGRGAEKGDWKL